MTGMMLLCQVKVKQPLCGQRENIFRDLAREAWWELPALHRAMGLYTFETLGQSCLYSEYFLSTKQCLLRFESWLSGKEQELLQPKTQVQTPAPMLGKLLTACYSSSRISGPIFQLPQALHAYAQSHNSLSFIHQLKNENNIFLERCLSIHSTEDA